jgi:hypothetical protein
LLFLQPSKYAWHPQKKSAILEAIKNIISHSTLTQHTLSAAGTVQVSHALPSVCFSCLLRGPAGPVCKMASQQKKAFCVLHEVSRSVITVQSEFRGHFKKDITYSCVMWSGVLPGSSLYSSLNVRDKVTQLYAK